MRRRDGYLSSHLKLIPRHVAPLDASIRNQQHVSESMNFTVVRAVRGSDLSPSRPTEGWGRGSASFHRSPAAMDLPYADEVLHLEISDFPETIPGALE